MRVYPRVIASLPVVQPVPVMDGYGYIAGTGTGTATVREGLPVPLPNLAVLDIQRDFGSSFELA